MMLCFGGVRRRCSRKLFKSGLLDTRYFGLCKLPLTSNSLSRFIPEDGQVTLSTGLNLKEC